MSHLTRRQLVGGALTAGAVIASVAPGAKGSLSTPAPPSSASAAQLPDLGFLRTERLANETRARMLLREHGYDGYIATGAPNILYLSNHDPLRARMSGQSNMCAVFGTAERLPLGLVMGQFSFYYSYQEAALDLGHEHYLYTSPDPESAGAAPPTLFRVIDQGAITPREQRRRSAVAAAERMFPDEAAALKAALRDLVGRRGRIATDDPALQQRTDLEALGYECVFDEDILRLIRLAKTPAELRLMALASRHNIAAAEAAAGRLREHRSIRQFRSDFGACIAAAGGSPVFMVIDGVSVDTFDDTLREGQGILIDCVSAFHGYHGDYGRTVLLGEGPRRLESTVAAVKGAWDSILESLRPGVSFSAIRATGRAALESGSSDVRVGFNPHAVGLYHTDQPRTARYRTAQTNDVLLVEDMILSVDCPVIDTGIGGTVHFEDLVRITPEGAVPIHRSPEALLRL